MLVAALDRGHRASWRNWKCSHLRVGWRTRTITRRRCIACGAASQVRHIIKRRAIVKLPVLSTILVCGMNGQHAHHLAVTCDDVFAGGDREIWRLHDQAVFFQPPICAVEFPLCRGDSTRGLQLLIVDQPHPPRTRVKTPQTPQLCATPGGRTRITQRSDKLRWNALELRLSISRRQRGQHEQSHRQECAAHQSLRSAVGQHRTFLSECFEF